jgi:hypothetical protein
VVGLVGGEDRRRVAAGHRAGGLRAPHRLAADLRPAGTGPPEGTDRGTSRRDGSACPTWSAPSRGRSGWRPTPTSGVPAAERVRAAPAGRGALDKAAAAAGLSPGDGARQQASCGPGLTRPRWPGSARAAGAAPHNPAVPVRLADLGPQADAADVRLPPPVRALRAARRSASAATSRCRCSPAAGSPAGSTRPGQWQNAGRRGTSSSRNPQPFRPWRELSPRPPSGSAARM